MLQTSTLLCGTSARSHSFLSGGMEDGTAPENCILLAKPTPPYQFSAQGCLKGKKLGLALISA